jgi:hypothetical protein
MNPNVPRWIQEMRIKDFLGHPYPWSRQSDVEQLQRQADIHMDRHAGHYSDTEWPHHHHHHHHHQPDWEGVLERFLLLGRPQRLADGQGDVGDMWNSFRRGGGGGSSTGYRGSNDSFANKDWANQFHTTEPADGHDPIINWERQLFDHLGPAGGYDPIVEWERRFFNTLGLAGGNDVHPDFDWGLHGAERTGNDLHGPDPFNEWFADFNSGPGLYDHQPQGIDGIFHSREPRPYGLLEDQLYGDDRISLDREPRPYAFHHDRLVHRNGDGFGDFHSRHDGLDHQQRAIEWRDHAHVGIDDIFGRPWDSGDDGLLPN